MTCPEFGRCEEMLRPNNTRPCNAHPCTSWVVGSWGQVSKHIPEKQAFPSAALLTELIMLIISGRQFSEDLTAVSDKPCHLVCTTDLEQWPITS